MQLPDAIVGRTWRDQSGRKLHVHRWWLGWPTSRWCATFRESNFSFRSLRALGRALKMSRLPALWADEQLVIELGAFALGPYMELSVQWNDRGEPQRLTPRVHDDWEPGFDVSWVFPLTPYELTER